MSRLLSSNYAALTWDDPNPLKRWIQRRRIGDALRRVPAGMRVSSVVDYGGGDGALAALAAQRWPQARIVVFEPYAEMATAARARLAGLALVSVVEHEGELPGDVDLVFCTEVFEHLPEAQTAEALTRIDSILRPGGAVVVGVPVEVGPVALLKGLFRKRRRPQAYDANLGRIWRATLGRPINDRPDEWIGDGRPYHSFHLGFDHRRLRRQVEAVFGPAKLTGSPIAWAPVLLNSEAYMTLTKPET